MGSEIARFRAQQALVEQATQAGLTGYATISRHDFIEKRMEQGAIYIQQLMDADRHDEAFALMETENWQGLVPATPAALSPQVSLDEQKGGTR